MRIERSRRIDVGNGIGFRSDHELRKKNEKQISFRGTSVKRAKGKRLTVKRLANSMSFPAQLHSPTTGAVVAC